MDVLSILTIYNEIDYLSLKIKWCKNNNLNLYIIDNMSNDGSWEYLNDNNIPCHQIDTNDEFHLEKLQKEIIKTTHKLKPDWVVYNGADLFFQLKENISLYEYIKKVDEWGFNLIQSRWINFYNTGEQHKIFNPFQTYYYYKLVKDPISLIYKYDKNIAYFGDLVLLENPTVNKFNGITINMGNTKPKEQRFETFKRRQLAWENGMKNGHGMHYKEAVKLNCVWNIQKNNLLDIRKSEYKDYYKRGIVD